MTDYMKATIEIVTHSIAQAIDFGLIAPEQEEAFRLFATAQARNVAMALDGLEADLAFEEAFS